MSREAREERIAARARQLYRDGFYTVEDGKEVIRLSKDLSTLIELEWMLTDAEMMARELKSVKPNPVHAP